jgi:hypothetical protein
LQNQTPGIGDFVEFRGRPWLVEGIEDKGGGLSAVKRSCISDDAQGEALEVAWHVEIGTQRLEDDMWWRVGRNGTDHVATFATYLRTLKWNTAIAADRHLFQALFRAGIRLDAYQLLSSAQGPSAPMRRAVRARTNGSVRARQAVEAFVTGATDPNELAVNAEEDAPTGRSLSTRILRQKLRAVGLGRGATKRSRTPGGCRDASSGKAT